MSTQQIWVLNLMLIGWFIKLSVQMLRPIIVFYLGDSLGIIIVDVMYINLLAIVILSPAFHFTSLRRRTTFLSLVSTSSLHVTILDIYTIF